MAERAASTKKPLRLMQVRTSVRNALESLQLKSRVAQFCLAARPFSYYYER
jgi:hypothetical protein